MQDELGGLLHHIDFRLRLGPAGSLMPHCAGGEGCHYLDKVVHLGQHDPAYARASSGWMRRDHVLVAWESCFSAVWISL